MRMEGLTYLIAPFTGTGTAWVRRGRRKTLKKPERTSPLRRFIILTYQTTNLNLLQSFTPFISLMKQKLYCCCLLMQI